MREPVLAVARCTANLHNVAVRSTQTRGCSDHFVPSHTAHTTQSSTELLFSVCLSGSRVYLTHPMDPSIISMEPRPRRAAIALRRCSSDPCQNNHRAFRDASALSSNARSRCILVGSSRSRQDRAFAVCGSPSPLRLPCQAMRALPPSAGVEEPRPAARPLVRPRTASGLMRLRRHYSLSRNSIRGLEAALVAQTMDPAVEATTDTTSVPSGVFEIEEVREG